jgi:hypothetical protein
MLIDWFEMSYKNNYNFVGVFWEARQVKNVASATKGFCTTRLGEFFQ